MNELKKKLCGIKNEEQCVAIVLEHLYYLFLDGDNRQFDHTFERWWELINEFSMLSLRYSNQIYSFGAVLYFGVVLRDYTSILRLLRKEICHFRQLAKAEKKIFECQ